MGRNAKVTLSLVIIGVMVIIVVRGALERARMNRSTPSITHISQNQFNNVVLRSAKPVVVDFYATWCPPCRVLSPMLDRVAPAFTNSVRFVKVNYDEAPGLASHYEIEGIPTLLMFRHGQVVNRTEGIPTEMALKAQLQYLAQGKPMPLPD